jgi:hypothetical protein
MSHNKYILPADYRIPPIILQLTDQDRAAIIDSAASTGAIFARQSDHAAIAAAYEERLESQQQAFKIAAQQFAECNPRVESELAKISARLEPVERIFNSQSSSTKGRLTEEFIMQYLSTGQHCNSTVRYTAKTGGMGDIWYTTASGITILIEIKNKRCVTTEDIQKFDRDVQQAYQAQEIMAAMIISLDAIRFPNLPSAAINYRMVGGCPTVHAYVDSVERIDQCIQTLCCIIEHGRRVDYIQFNCATQQETDRLAEYAALKKILTALDNSRASIQQRMLYLAAQSDLNENVEYASAIRCTSMRHTSMGNKKMNKDAQNIRTEPCTILPPR